jgi:60kDa lysophospholipase
MIKHPIEGYQPHASFLTETLRTQARFHDPFANSIFSWADSVDRYQMWSGVHSAAGSRSASPSRTTEGGSALAAASGSASPSNAHLGRNGIAAVQEKLVPDNRADPASSNSENTRGRGRVWPPFGSHVKVRSSSTKGVSTLNAKFVQVVDGPAASDGEANDSTKILDMELPTLVTPKGAGGKRVRYAVLEYDPVSDKRVWEHCHRTLNQIYSLSY